MTLEHDLINPPLPQANNITLSKLPTWLCRLWHKMLTPLFKHFEHGRIEITLPSGGHLVYGAGSPDGPTAHVTVHQHATLWRILSRGPLGLAESYMDAQWSCDDLTTLFDICLKNRAIFEAIRARGSIAHLFARLKHLSRANSLNGSRRNIAYHYDLGNDFYALWLDRTMTYSSALGVKDGEDLAISQWRKFDKALAMCNASDGDHILEIGCGWGAFAERAADAGCHIDGLTLSQEQHAYSIARAEMKEFDDRARFHLRDYRHETGTYDAIVSIEMIEAVGEENWPIYFQCLRDRLKPGGQAAIQAITIHDDQYDRYRRSADFIQTYIFPGGMLPTKALLKQHAQGAGLEVVEQHIFGSDYAKTLARWRQDFLLAWPKISALGYDERFRRMWLYYLSYCEAGFENGTIDVGLYSFRKPD
nr:cyclopropane-fatty-acyl-phospholipid synthase family protein [uncultured Cohaesibacter sp.]